jgi:predicted DNA-binding protein (UPF0251 family)
MMPRRKKIRRCELSCHRRIFKPAGIPLNEIDMEYVYHDELESMKLCDLLDMSQADAGEKMGVSRGTVQRLLYSCRMKLVRALLENKAIIVLDENKKEEVYENLFSSES